MIQFGPPKVQVIVLASVSAGVPPIRTFGAPGSHMGGKSAGAHGGVPGGILVAGFEGELHIPKDPFGISMIVKSGFANPNLTLIWEPKIGSGTLPY